MAEVIDGRLIASQIENRVAQGVLFLQKLKFEVCLAVVVVGFNSVSKIYIKNKAKVCEKLKIKLKEIELSVDVSKEEFERTIRNLNCNKKINGILVQLPLPEHLNKLEFADLISPFKDVDGFCSENIGRLFLNRPCLKPCTAAGIVEMLDYERVDLTGKHCVVVGKSNIVGKPLSLMLLNRSATVTICCSKTINLEKIVKEADIVISAAGRARLITGSMIKIGAIVVDVGINRLNNGKICGDVFFEEVEKIASKITPVPGGVGPLTVAKLMENLLYAAKIQYGCLE